MDPKKNKEDYLLYYNLEVQDTPLPTKEGVKNCSLVEQALNNIDGAIVINDAGEYVLDETFDLGLFDLALASLQSGDFAVVDGERVREVISYAECGSMIDVIDIRDVMAYLQRKDTN